VSGAVLFVFGWGGGLGGLCVCVGGVVLRGGVLVLLLSMGYAHSGVLFACLPTICRRLVPITEEEWMDVQEDLLPGTKVSGPLRAASRTHRPRIRIPNSDPLPPPITPLPARSPSQ